MIDFKKADDSFILKLTDDVMSFLNIQNTYTSGDNKVYSVPGYFYHNSSMGTNDVMSMKTNPIAPFITDLEINSLGWELFAERTTGNLTCRVFRKDLDDESYLRLTYLPATHHVTICKMAIRYDYMMSQLYEGLSGDYEFFKQLNDNIK